VRNSPYRRAAFTLLAGLALAIGPAAADMTDAEHPAVETVRGVLSSAGSTLHPIVQLRAESVTWRVTGALAESDLWHLLAFTVIVHGVPGKEGGGALPTLDARDYEVADIGSGVRPLVGLVEVVGGEFFLRLPLCADHCVLDGALMNLGTLTRTRVVPNALGRRLSQHSGALVWFTATRDDSASLKLQRFGIIRDKMMVP
jgi:hypothetical protein